MTFFEEMSSGVPVGHPGWVSWVAWVLLAVVALSVLWRSW